VNDSIELEKIKGRQPKNERLIQLRVTVKNPSRIESSVGMVVKKMMIVLRTIRLPATAI